MRARTTPATGATGIGLSIRNCPEHQLRFAALLALGVNAIGDSAWRLIDFDLLRRSAMVRRQELCDEMFHRISIAEDLVGSTVLLRRSVGRQQLIHVHPPQSAVLDGDSVSECKRQTTNAIAIISACDLDCVSFRCSGPSDSVGERALTASQSRLRPFQRVTRRVHHGNRIVGVPV